MWIFYAMSLMPVIIGLAFWLADKRVTWWEWASGVGIGFLLSLFFHLIAFYGMTSDVETWSGRITQIIHYPEWVERYTTDETTTDSKGNTHHHTETHYRTHDEYWEAKTDLNTSQTIECNLYNDIKQKFGNYVETEDANNDGFYSGDDNIYVTNDDTHYVYPVIESREFTNKIKATPSLFSFASVPKDAPVFDYPENEWTTSGRLLGTAKNLIDIRMWDQMNSRLGPSKKVNVIMVGFPPGVGIDVGQMQQAKWIGGRKNDLVITFSSDGAFNVKWVYVFGWTDKEIVKQNLQTILLNHPINNDLLPIIEKEIRDNYVIKDWSQFDYLSIYPPIWSYFVFFFVLTGAQVGFWLLAERYNKSKS